MSYLLDKAQSYAHTIKTQRRPHLTRKFINPQTKNSINKSHFLLDFIIKKPCSQQSIPNNDLSQCLTCKNVKQNKQVRQKGKSCRQRPKSAFPYSLKSISYKPEQISQELKPCSYSRLQKRSDNNKIKIKKQRKVYLNQSKYMINGMITSFQNDKTLQQKQGNKNYSNRIQQLQVQQPKYRGRKIVIGKNSPLRNIIFQKSQKVEDSVQKQKKQHRKNLTKFLNLKKNTKNKFNQSNFYNTYSKSQIEQQQEKHPFLQILQNNNEQYDEDDDFFCLKRLNTIN